MFHDYVNSGNTAVHGFTEFNTYRANRLIFFLRDKNDKIGLHTTLYKKIINHIVNINHDVSIASITYRFLKNEFTKHCVYNI